MAEIAIAACDLAEVLGMAIGIHLLTGFLFYGAYALQCWILYLLLVLQRYGMRKMEAFIIALVATIGLSFLIELIFAQPHFGDVVKGFVPTPLNNEALIYRCWNYWCNSNAAQFISALRTGANT